MSEIGVIKKAIARTNSVDIGKAMSLGMKLSAGYIALGTAIDTGSKINEHQQVKNQRRADLKALKKQQKDQMNHRKNPRKALSNQLGQMPLDLFNQRIGHTNMGNSKYTR